MPRLICHKGHEWEPPAEEADATLVVNPLCPVCGAPVGPVVPTDSAGPALETIAHEPGPSATPGATLATPGATLATTPGSSTPGNSTPGATPGEVRVPGFEILETLGRGGMGIVYKARHVKLNRVVALKMLLAGHAAAREKARFQAEARAVAELNHPNIVRIYSVGEHAGRAYLALEYVDGGTLGDRLDGTARPAPESARLVEVLARAVQVAHDCGIIHRDLKPANILLARPVTGEEDPQADTDFGRPKIADFGLAKRLAGAGDAGAGQTQSGAIVGTPSYMAPEQASGKVREVSPAVDVWALGAILYELLTGRPPFQSGTTMGTVLQVISDDVVPPRRHNPAVPADLETICLKCLRKPPAERYASAAHLADDLSRFRRGEPILARRVGTLERAAKWARRRPMTALAMVVGLLALVAGTVLYAPDLHRLATNQGQVNLEPGEHDIRIVVRQDGREVARLDGRDRTRTLPAGEYTLEREGPWTGAELTADTVTVTRNGIATVPVQTSPVGEIRQFVGHTGPIRRVALSPDGRLALSASGNNGDQTLRLWDVLTGVGVRQFKGHEGAVHSVVFFPDQKQAMSCGADGTVRIWEVATGREVRCLRGHRLPVWNVAIDRDGKRALSCGTDFAIRLWDTENGQELDCFEGHTAAIESVDFSPDGRRFASCGHDGTIRIWDLERGELLRQISNQLSGVVGLAWSPDGHQLLTGGWDRSVRLWDAESGQQIRQFRGHTAPVFATRFLPNGRQVLSAGLDRTLRVWDIASGSELTSVLPSTDGIISIASSVDGSRVLLASGHQTGDSATPGTDFTLRLWGLPYFPPEKSSGSAVPLGYELRNLQVPSGSVFCLAVSADGRAVVTGGSDGSIRVHDVETGDERARLLLTGAPVYAVVYTPDEKRLVSASQDGLRVWDTRTGEVIRMLTGHIGTVWDVAVSPDGKRALSAGNDRSVRLWDLETGRQVFKLDGHTDLVRRVSFSPDGTRAVSGGHDKAVILWNLESGTAFRRHTGHTDRIQTVAFSPDGKHTLSGGHDRTLILSAVADGREVRRFQGHTNSVENVTFAPDGTTAASCGYDGLVLLHDIATGGEIGICPAYGSLYAVKFAADGGVWSAGNSTIVRRWSRPGADLPAPVVAPPAKPAGELLRLRGHRNPVLTVAVSPDGRHALTAGNTLYSNNRWLDGSDPAIRLWDLETGKEVRQFEGHTGSVFGLAFSPDGRRALSAGADHTVRLWDVSTGKELRKFVGHTNHVRGVAFSADGTRALSGSKDCTVRLWDPESGNALQTMTFPGQFAWCVAFAPDGKSALSGHDGMLAQWDLGTGQRVRTIQSHFSTIRTVAFLPGTGTVITCGNDGLVKQWDPDGFAPVGRLILDRGWVLGAAALPDGRRVVTCNSTGPVRLWDLPSGRELVCFRGHTGMAHGVAVTPDGRRILSVGLDKTVRVWEVPETPAKQDPGQVWITSVHPTAEVVVTREGGNVVGPTNRRLLDLPPGEYDLALAGDDKDLRLFPTKAIVRTGEKTPAQIIRTVAPQTYPRTPAEIAGGNLPHAEAARQFMALDRSFEALSRWRLALSDLDRTEMDLARRRTLRADLLREAKKLLDERLAVNATDAGAAFALSSLLLEFPEPVEWTVLESTVTKSAAGATLTLQPDGSTLASGISPPDDTYTIEVTNTQKGITALRLEALPHATLPNNGPGRDPGQPDRLGGNFHLTEISLTAHDEDGTARPIRLVRAGGYQRYTGASTIIDGPHGAIDGLHSTRWDIFPNQGRESIALFEFDRPVEAARLTVRLDFQDPVWKRATLGRFRLSVTTRPNVVRDEQLRTLALRASPRARLGTAYFLRGEPAAALAAFTMVNTPLDRLLQVFIEESLGRPVQDERLEAALSSATTGTIDAPVLLTAFELLTLRIAREPKARWLQTRAQLHARFGRWRAMLADVGAALEVEPDRPLGRQYAAAHLWAAHFWMRSYRPDRAATHALAAAILDPRLAESPLRGHAFLTRSGRWKVEGEELIVEAPASTGAVQFGDPNWTDYDIEVEVKRDRGENGFAILFRRGDGPESIQAEIGALNQFHRVNRFEDGKWTNLAVVPAKAVEDNHWYKVKCEVRGERVRVVLDGMQVIEATGVRLARGEVGLRAWSSTTRFRNIKVTAPNGEVLFQGLPHLHQPPFIGVWPVLP